MNRQVQHLICLRICFVLPQTIGWLWFFRCVIMNSKTYHTYIAWLLAVLLIKQNVQVLTLYDQVKLPAFEGFETESSGLDTLKVKLSAF